jgi:methylenetetrahydrofolate reductase (NADPH)
VLPPGCEIAAPPQLFIGAADTPIDPDLDWRPDRLIEKADAGARFVQMQFCFDIDILARYVARLHDCGVTERLFILPGLGPIASARSARWMRDNLWGVIIPDAVIARLEGAVDERAEGRRICIELIEQAREIEGVAGVHVMAIRQHDAVPEIVEAAGIGPAQRGAKRASGLPKLTIVPDSKE